VLVLDQNHTIILANPVAADLLGEPLLNMNFLTVIGECAASMSRDGTQIVLRSGRRVSLSNQVHDGYGDQIVLITDITETYAAQAASHRDERLAAMGAMVARLAHQIRTPLASALLYLGAMERTQLDADDRQTINGKVRSRLKHLESLVNDSLHYVKGGETCTQDCSLFELLDALKASLAPVVEEKSCRWIESRPQEDVQIVGNQEALLSALVAIAENAVQLNDGAIITVSAATTAAGLQIEITDNGSGISPDIIDHIFDPYYSTRPGGTGLGLALAAVIARNHEAELIATNLKTGGARFTLTLPDERVQSMVAPSQASARLTGENLNG
jgi:two-component system sensor histidine kinase FlrB